MCPEDDSETERPKRERPRRGKQQVVRATKPLTLNSVLEEPGGPEPGSRTSQKRERVNMETALSDLAEELMQLSVPRLTKLDLGERALDALIDAKKIKSPIALARQMRLVRARLRDGDWMAVRVQLDQLRAGYQTLQKGSDRLTELTEELLVQGDVALSRLVDTYPTADAGRIRQLMRNVQKAGEGKRAKARAALAAMIAEFVPEQDEF